MSAVGGLWGVICDRCGVRAPGHARDEETAINEAADAGWRVATSWNEVDLCPDCAEKVDPGRIARSYRGQLGQ